MLTLRPAALIAACAALLTVPAAAFAAPTDLDPAFSGDGKMIDNTLFSTESIYSSTVQDDGKIVTVGSDNGSQKWLIMRFNTDGTLDTAFDGPSGTGNGKVFLDPSTSYDAAYDVVLTATGKIVVGGRVRNTTSGKTEFGAVRLLDDGTIDPTFNSGAVKSFEIDDAASGQDAYATSVALDSGKIVIGGYANDGVGAGGTDFAIGRLEFGGALDTTFDGDGTGLKSVTAGAADYISDIGVQAGKIVAVGTTSDPANAYNRVFTAVRYTDTGSPDTTFGAAATGKVYMTALNGYSSTTAVNSSGDIAIVGTTDGASDCLVGQITSDGAIDTSFSADGMQSVDFGARTDFCNAAAFDGSDRLVIGGSSYAQFGDADIAIARLTAVGDLDTDFDPDGKFTLRLTAANDNVNTLESLSGGEILAGGYQGEFGGTAGVLLQFAGGSGGFPVPTRPPEIALDPEFSGDGLARTDLADTAGRSDSAVGLAVAPDDSSFAVGSGEHLYSSSPETYLIDAVVAKYRADGSLETAFSGDGKATYSGGSLSAETFRDAAALSGGGVVVAGDISLTGSGTDALLAQYASGGSLDPAFGGGDGVVSHDFGVDDRIEAVERLSDGSLLIAGESRESGGDPTMLAAKLTPQGDLDTSWGDNGVRTVSFGAFETAGAAGAAALPDGSLVLAGYDETGVARNAAVAVLDANGDLDPNFSGDGKLVLSIGDGDSQADGVAVQSNGRILLAGRALDGETSWDSFAARLLEDGTPDSGFSGDGYAFVEFSSADDAAGDVVVAPSSGEITIGGYANYGLDDDFSFARFDASGQSLASFDSDGMGSTPVGSDTDRIAALAIDSRERVVGAGAAYTGSLADFALARLPGLNPPPPPPPPAPPAPAIGSPSSKVSRPKHKGHYSPGKARDFKGSGATTLGSDGVYKVEIALRRVDSKHCYWLSSSSVKFKSSKPSKGKCETPRWIKAKGTTSWSYRIKNDLPDDDYEIYARVRLVSGATETRRLSGTNKIRFEVR